MSDYPVFDESVFNELEAELGRVDATEVLQTFLADTSGKMELFASNSFDRAVVKRHAHSIKSSAATFGFEKLSQRARALETGADAMAPAALTAAIEALQRAFVETWDSATMVTSGETSR